MRSFPLWVCLVAVVNAGCGRSELAQRHAPHGGTIILLADHPGCIEAVRADVPGDPDRARLLLYFLDPAGKAMTAGPTTASLKPQGRGTASVNFKPVVGGDPAQAGALESAPFPVSGDVSGLLTTSIAGKPVTATIHVR